MHGEGDSDQNGCKIGELIVDKTLIKGDFEICDSLVLRSDLVVP